MVDHISTRKEFIKTNTKNVACLVSQMISSHEDLLVGKAYNHRILDPLNNELINIGVSNSWTAQLEDIELTELNEVFQVNIVAPFLLNTKLKPLLERKNSSLDPRFIVNVSAMEGVFYRTNKKTTHPHTNMAKAALNMMTRTAGAHYAESGIYMTAVDTGWVTDEKPVAG